MAKKIKPVSKIVRTETRIIRKDGRYYIQSRKSYGFEENWIPAVDISEKNGEIYIEGEVPGVAPEDITITVHTNLVEIKGIKREKFPQKKIRFFRMEREHGTFQRFIFLPGSVNPEKTRAVLENGILIITLVKL